MNNYNDLLDELCSLTEKEYETKLNNIEEKRYLEIVEILQKNNIVIPFGMAM